MDPKTADLIARLKAVREERGLTYQDIVDMCEGNGEPVSMSTVRRVFASDGIAGFRYDTTLGPIVRAVLDIEDGPQNKGEPPEVEALKTIIAIKNDMIAAKDEEIARLMRTSKSQLDSRDGSVEYLKRMIDRQRRSLMADRIFSIVLLVLIIIALVADIINPGLGMFRG